METKLPGVDEHGNKQVVAQVSDASRIAGRMGVEDRLDAVVDSRTEEMRDEERQLVAEKQQIETELSVKYGKSAYYEAQRMVRQAHYGACEKDSVQAWLGKRAAMDSERNRLVERKNAIERTLRPIRAARIAREQSVRSTVGVPELLCSIVQAVRESNVLLARIEKELRN